MANSPAMLLYTKDWLTGTAEMEPAEKGIYIDLMCYQQINGSLPKDVNKLAKLCGISVVQFQGLWIGIKHKFIEIDERLVNQRVKQVVEQSADRALKNKINGSLPRIIEKFDLKKVEKKQIYSMIYESINYSDFIKKTDKEIKQSLNQLVDQMVNYIANANVDANANENKNEDVNDDISFDDFWNLYNKKVGDKKKCEKKWIALKNDQRKIIMQTLPKWVKQFSDKQFQPYPETYLNQERWNDEIKVTKSDSSFD